ncbi:carbohydrate kinase family protein [Natronoglycomyces albus]|uniref:Carbohydrate kinase family protein n=1 Tax=Natronoglycomyces albus TaxID=2811108 RepID=A0A895XUA1_9ACTN|nr:carbohydrate kinase family protein [Natronoglycomyces albus]
MLVAGGVGVDTIVRVPELTIGHGDSQAVQPIRDFVAHTGNGVALGLHNLGVATTLVDFVGEDEQGRMVLDHYHRWGLDFRHLPAPEGTPRSVNLVDDLGRRYSFYDGRHPENLRLPGHLYRPLLQTHAHVHVSITNVTRDLLTDALDSSATISTDLHSWDGVSDHHRRWAYAADIVFVSTERLGGYRAPIMRDILRRGRAQVVIAMAGSSGCFVLEHGHNNPTHYPAVVPRQDLKHIADWIDWLAVDSNGAGDAFVSGFLWEYLYSGHLQRAVTAGRICGAFACRKAGTHSEFISEDLLTASTNALAAPS